jgi:hypothetical protein
MNRLPLRCAPKEKFERTCRAQSATPKQECLRERCRAIPTVIEVWKVTTMPSVLETVPESILEAQSRPHLTSFDSAAENSLGHFRAVQSLVEQEYTFLDADFEWRQPSSLVR